MNESSFHSRIQGALGFPPAETTTAYMWRVLFTGGLVEALEQMEEEVALGRLSSLEASRVLDGMVYGLNPALLVPYSREGLDRLRATDPAAADAAEMEMELVRLLSSDGLIQDAHLDVLEARDEARLETAEEAERLTVNVLKEDRLSLRTFLADRRVAQYALAGLSESPFASQVKVVRETLSGLVPEIDPADAAVLDEGLADYLEDRGITPKQGPKP